MMTFDPGMRPTARDMLRHEWVREGGVAGDNVLQPEVGRRRGVCHARLHRYVLHVYWHARVCTHTRVCVRVCV